MAMTLIPMVHIALESAASHGINLHHGVPNLANGDCLFESIADNISTRPCFNETWSGSAAYNRKIWMENEEDLVFGFSGGAGRTEKNSDGNGPFLRILERMSMDWLTSLWLQ
jgi:hypothetical protein